MKKEENEKNTNNGKNEIGGVKPFIGRSSSTPIIKIIGCGGAGSNAVEHMAEIGLDSAELYIINTDYQALVHSKVPNKIQIGAELTKGRGAGAVPEIGRRAAEESRVQLTEAIKGTDLLFIAAGMGGGTGTGSAPVVANIARELGILTIAFVTKPFEFEGKQKMINADLGIANLKKFVDTIVVIPNEKLLQQVPDMPIDKAFAYSDDSLRKGVQGISDLIVKPALVNIDFADLSSTLRDKGVARMGIGKGNGKNRVKDAIEMAMYNPLLEETFEGASAVIVNIIGKHEIKLNEVKMVADYIRKATASDCMVIFGAGTEPRALDDMTITLIAAGSTSTKIKVIGIGGAGLNAVNRMANAGFNSAELIAINTDFQALKTSKAHKRIQIGEKLTGGRGSGAVPDVGRRSAEENKEEITEAIKGANLLFLTAGMGGGTGTGATPVIARIARELGILTIAFVTKPFSFEGKQKLLNAEAGIENLKKYVDTVVVLPNEKLMSEASEMSIEEAFQLSDEVLRQGVQGLADLIVLPALVNIDFADVTTIMKDKGIAHMGIGFGDGNTRVRDAVKQAVENPLLENSIAGSTSVMINISGNTEIKIKEVKEITDMIHSKIQKDALVIFGAGRREDASNELIISLITAGSLETIQTPPPSSSTNY